MSLFGIRTRIIFISFVASLFYIILICKVDVSPKILEKYGQIISASDKTSNPIYSEHPYSIKKTKEYLIEYETSLLLNSHQSYPIKEERVYPVASNWKKWITSDNSHLYLYSAYYDNRTQVTNAPVIRIVAMQEHHKGNNLSYTCQIMFADNVKVIKPIKKIQRLQARDRITNQLQAFVISCELGKTYRDKIPVYVSINEKYGNKIPKSISIIEKKEELVKQINITYSPILTDVVKENFALCLKGFYFPDKDISLYLVQWFELLFIMGVHKIFIYMYDVHPNMLKVLKYYESMNKIKMTKFSLPMNLTKTQMNTILLNDNIIKRQAEHIAYNDCLYKTMNSYKYVAILDYDEIIIPTLDYNWIDMINRKQNTKSYSAFSFARYISLNSMQLNTPILPGSTEELKILFNTRSQFSKGVKTIVDTAKTVAVSIHLPSICTEGECRTAYIDQDIGYLVHYRTTCKKGQEKYCSNKTIKRDIPIERYKKTLMKNIHTRLKTIIEI